MPVPEGPDGRRTPPSPPRPPRPPRAPVATGRRATGRTRQVRYSKACGAAWGRLRGGRIGDRLELRTSGGSSQSTRVTDRFDADGYVFTPMAAASGPEKLRVCLRPAGGGPAECFRTS
ncbi:DUF2690 domain-containing protein [Streptomyces rimosus]|uniref:DUF2690 domain-containing protein n=1 Tax=Streptomyces rimosus TaxID=1927 RepID=UPI000AD3091B|nr:DUF2690 domain-containing protein [Streptomyces rimosus]